jgi:SAM-dependent methyltransferase
MAGNKLRKFFSTIRNTPFHPQWFAVRKEKHYLAAIGARVHGQVLDIGCGEQKPRHYMNPDAIYIGLDNYRTATEWYGTRPQIYSDARALPFREASFDWVLLLDVLEHIPAPNLSVSEAFRVLKSGGRLILQVPFLYPAHDAPLDFHRWTLYGLNELARITGFTVVEKMPLGTPLECAALLCNLAFSKSVLNWIKRKNPLAITVLFLPFFVLCSNLLAWILSTRPEEDDGFMPYAYRMVLEKP